MKSIAVFLTLLTFSLGSDRVSREETTFSTVDPPSTYGDISNQDLLDYDDNSTEMSWPTNATSTPTSTSAPSSTTAETVSKVTERRKPTTPASQVTRSPTTAFPKMEMKYSESCSCDVTGVYCDINCCCDADCDDDDRKAFNFCSAEPSSRLDTGLCFSRQFIYSNNTRLTTEESEKGLFCISKDNLPGRIHFADQKVIESPITFNKIWRRRQHYSWSLTGIGPREMSFSTANPYQYGTPVWRFINSTNDVISLVIPVSGPSAFCRSTRIVRFLENVESRCLQKVTIDEDECELSSASEFLNSITLVPSPLLVNASNIENATALALIEVRLVMCQNESNCQATIVLPSLEYNKTASTCSNVPKRLQLTIYHNGTRGIVEAELKAYLVAIDRTTYIEQAHSVTFEWAKVKKGPRVIRRSGTPGYLEGRPILTNSRPSLKYEESFGLFSLPKAHFPGDCVSERQIVLFKHNVRTQCDLVLNNVQLTSEQDIERIQQKIWSVLFGNIKINSSDSSRLEMYVSTLGDPEQFKPADWVPVHVDNVKSPLPQRARSFSTGVSWTVVYALIGPFTDPQAKIIGAVARLYDARRLRCSNETACSVKVTASVNFVDSSKMVVSKFAKAPVVKIRLPKDFFYPFSSKAPGMRSECFIFVLIVHCFSFGFLL